MNYKSFLPIAAALLLAACSNNDWKKGNPQLEVVEDLGSAYFGDSLRVTVKASDGEVPLSTLKARLYFGEELVSEDVVRTKVSGEKYEAAVYIPYLANIRDGRATLELIVQNINFTTATKTYEVAISHPDYESLTFITEDGSKEYEMKRLDKYEYEFAANLPQELKGYIVAPAYGENGNKIVFGYENSAIKAGAESPIPFTSLAKGVYKVHFNTYTFEGSPFNVVKCNGVKFTGNADGTSYVDLTLSQGGKVEFEGVPDYETYWIDPDWFSKADDGSLNFLPIGGNYRITLDPKNKFFRVCPIANGKPATLQPDGSGCIWIIGDNFGKPSLENTVGWVTEKAVAMAPIGGNKYQVTVVGGEQVSLDAINFKFFHQDGWGGEFGHATLTSTSDLVHIGTGDVDESGSKHDDGNLYLMPGDTMEEGATYIFIIDASAGSQAAVLSVQKL